MTTITFVSAVRPNRALHTNEWFVDRLGQSLEKHKLDHVRANGVFHNEAESGFIVQTYTDEQLWLVRLLAERHGQEAIIEMTGGFGCWKTAYWVSHGERKRLGIVSTLTGDPPAFTYFAHVERKTGWFRLGNSYYLL